MLEQKVINLNSYNGGYYNFFHSPGSTDSLQNHLDLGWVVKFIQDNPAHNEAIVLFERDPYHGKLRSLEGELAYANHRISLNVCNTCQNRLELGV